MPGGPPRGGLAGRDFALLLAASLGTFANYATMLSVVPMWAASGATITGAVTGGAVTGGAGATTGVTMAGTVAAQLCMPWLHRRLRLPVILAVGALVLGVPTFGYAVSSSIGWVLAISAVRGVGFGVVAVAGSALVAELVPPSHRGRAVGRYGLAVGLPQVIALPLGVWAAQHLGFTLVFAVTGATSALAFPLALAMRRGEARPRSAARAAPGLGSDRASTVSPDPVSPDPVSPDPVSMAGLRRLAGPWLLVIVVSAAFGGITAFVPLRFAGSAVAPGCLFVMSAALIVGRWTAGARSDRTSGSDRTSVGGLLTASVAACALGMAGLAAAAALGAASIALPAAAVYGLGFGGLQNDTLIVMFRRGGPAGHGLSSTVWNLAIDAGTGVGAAAIGWGSGALGLGGAFAVSAAAIAALAPVALAIRQGTQRRDGGGGSGPGSHHEFVRDM